MADKKIEYGVWDNDENELLINTDTDRERAFRLAKYWNLGKEGRVTVVDRTVETSDWKPANTGVVPPIITERSHGTDE
jgi:hypothetical protein